MPILIKVPPQELAPVPVSIDVPKTKIGIAKKGERAFVWFSETQGGRGLIARGIVHEIEPCSEKTIRITLSEMIIASKWLGNAQLEPLRNSDSVTPDSTLAKKLYKYSLNRAVRLTDEEDNFLNSFVG